MAKYKQIVDGVSFYVRDGEEFAQQCCGCSLVHDVTIRVMPSGRLKLTMRTNAEETKRLRKADRALAKGRYTKLS